MTGNPEAGRTRRTLRTSVDWLQVEICHGSAQMRQQEQTCGKSDDSDTAHTSIARLHHTLHSLLRMPNKGPFFVAYQNLPGRCLVCEHGSHVIKIPKAEWSSVKVNN